MNRRSSTPQARTASMNDLTETTVEGNREAEIHAHSTLGGLSPEHSIASQLLNASSPPRPERTPITPETAGLEGGFGELLLQVNSTSTDEETDLARYGEHSDPSDLSHQAGLLKLELSKATPKEAEDEAKVLPQSGPSITTPFKDRLQRFFRSKGVIIKTYSNATTILLGFGNAVARELSDKLNTKLQTQQAETEDAIAKKEAASIRWKRYYDEMRERADARETENAQLKEELRAEHDRTITAMNRLRAEREQTTTEMRQLGAEHEQTTTEKNQLRKNNIELRKREQESRQREQESSKKEQELKEDLEREKQKQQLARNAEAAQTEVMQKRHKEELQKLQQRWSHMLTDLEVKNNDLRAAQGVCIHSSCRECDPKPEHQLAKDEPVVRPDLFRAQSMVSVSSTDSKHKVTAPTIEELFKMTQEQVLSYQGPAHILSFDTVTPLKQYTSKPDSNPWEWGEELIERVQSRTESVDQKVNQDATAVLYIRRQIEQLLVGNAKAFYRLYIEMHGRDNLDLFRLLEHLAEQLPHRPKRLPELWTIQHRADERVDDFFSRLVNAGHKIHPGVTPEIIEKRALTVAVHLAKNCRESYRTPLLAKMNMNVERPEQGESALAFRARTLTCLRGIEYLEGNFGSVRGNILGQQTGTVAAFVPQEPGECASPTFWGESQSFPDTRYDEQQEVTHANYANNYAQLRTTVPYGWPPPEQGLRSPNPMEAADGAWTRLAGTASRQRT